MKISARVEGDEIAGIYSRAMRRTEDIIFQPQVFLSESAARIAKVKAKREFSNLNPGVMKIIMDSYPGKVDRLIAFTERQLNEMGRTRKRDKGKTIKTLEPYFLKTKNEFIRADYRIMKYIDSLFQVIERSSTSLAGLIDFMKSDPLITGDLNLQFANPVKDAWIKGGPIYDEIKRIIRNNKTILRLFTKDGFPYRGEGTLREAFKKIMELFKKMFGDIDFLLINGRHYNPSSYVKMLTRTNLTHAGSLSTIQTCREYEHFHIKFSEHIGSCRICAPYQGNAYSLRPNDIYGFPLPDIEIPVHPNCEHSWIPWDPIFDL